MIEIKLTCVVRDLERLSADSQKLNITTRLHNHILVNYVHEHGIMYPIVGIVGVKGQIGFRELPSIIDCPNILRFTCVSTGSGRTELMIGDNMLFRFLHSEYAGGANINESQLDGNITAGNLSRSAGMDCSDMTDYCYTMFVEVHLTEQTSCRVISCTTILLNGSEINVGSSTASRSTRK